MALNLPSRPAQLFNSTSQFTHRKKIGFGAFANVYEATCKKTLQKFALKEFDLNACDQNKLDLISNEVKKLSQLSNDRCVKMIDFFSENQKLYLVIELMEKGSLFDLLKSAPSLPAPILLSFFKQTALAISLLHDQHLLYRDLKPENILLSAQLSLKLCDFSWSCFEFESPFNEVPAGTPAYMSPEQLEGKPQTRASDVWGLGVLLFELFYNREPFVGEDEEEIYKKILEWEAGDKSRARWGRAKVNLAPGVEEAIKGMLRFEPKERLTIKQALTLLGLESENKLGTVKNPSVSQVPVRVDKDRSADIIRNPSSHSNLFSVQKPAENLMVKQSQLALISQPVRSMERIPIEKALLFAPKGTHFVSNHKHYFLPQHFQTPSQNVSMNTGYYNIYQNLSHTQSFKDIPVSSKVIFSKDLPGFSTQAFFYQGHPVRSVFKF